MSASAKPKYRTTNWKDYNTALKARGSLLIWLDKGMRRHGSASGKRGRRPKYSEAAIQFCLTIKGLFNPALRQAMGMAQSLLKIAGLDWQVPDFSTVSRRQKHLSVTIAAQPTTTRLHLLTDRTGIKMLGEGEWKTKKHGADYRRQWRKVHLGIDAATRALWRLRLFMCRFKPLNSKALLLFLRQTVFMNKYSFTHNYVVEGCPSLCHRPWLSDRRRDATMTSMSAYVILSEN
jgi:hypothetical protein